MNAGCNKKFLGMPYSASFPEDSKDIGQEEQYSKDYAQEQCILDI